MPLRLVIIRGLPGSGKSTLAKTLGIDHYEADMYFVDKTGHYCFDGKKIKQAHAWCLDQVKNSLVAGRSVVVSNTFVRKWEMAPYLALAEQYRAETEVIECKGSFRNIHDVPRSVRLKMLKNWENQ